MFHNIHEMDEWGEEIVKKICDCPKCKRIRRTFKKFQNNFECADVICDFCGFLAQVITTKQNDINEIPNTILGAGWSVQKGRMDSDIYFPLYLVIAKDRRNYAIYYLSSDLQKEEMFVPRNSLSNTAQRAGRQRFLYRFSEDDKKRFVRLY